MPSESQFLRGAPRKATRTAALLMIARRRLNLSTLLLSLALHQAFATDLTISHLGAQVILSWPVNSPNDFYLQIATNLSAPISWINAPDPATNGADLVITNTTAGTSSFYRLQAWDVLFDGTNTAQLRSPTAASFPSNSWFVT